MRIRTAGETRLDSCEHQSPSKRTSDAERVFDVLLRVSELLKLDWSKVQLSERAIIVDGAVAKTRARRVITVNDTLARWIARYAKPSGPVVGATNFRKRRDALIHAAGIRWPDNALRHSFGSYYYAQCKDADRVSAEMGNTPQIVLKHYRALVLQADAQRSWNLRPARKSLGPRSAGPPSSPSAAGSPSVSPGIRSAETK